MKNFKKIFAIFFIVATLVFGVLVLIQELETIKYVQYISSSDATEQAKGIVGLILLVSDVLLLLSPIIGIFPVIFNKLVPFKAIVGCAVVVLIKFIIAIFSKLIVFILVGAPAEVYKEYFFGAKDLAIVPSIMFVISLVLLIICTANQYEATLKRVIMSITGAALAVSGLSFYYIAKISIDPKLDWLKIFGLVVAIALQAGIIIYSTLPQTREYKKVEKVVEVEEESDNY